VCPQLQLLDPLEFERLAQVRSKSADTAYANDLRRTVGAGCHAFRNCSAAVVPAQTTWMKTPALVKYGTAVRALPCRDAGRLSINGTESPRAGGRFKPSAGAPTYKHRHESRPDRAKLVRKQPHSPPCARRGGVPVYNQQVERIHRVRTNRQGGYTMPVQYSTLS